MLTNPWREQQSGCGLVASCLLVNKTEVLILKGPNKGKGVVFEVLGSQIMPGDELRYLEVTLDRTLKLSAHGRRVVKRAESGLAAFLNIMSNVGGPSSKRKEPLYGAVQSQVLYAA